MTFDVKLWPSQDANRTQSSWHNWLSPKSKPPNIWDASSHGNGSEWKKCSNGHCYFQQHWSASCGLVPTVTLLKETKRGFHSEQLLHDTLLDFFCDPSKDDQPSLRTLILMDSSVGGRLTLSFPKREMATISLPLLSSNNWRKSPKVHLRSSLLIHGDAIIQLLH